MIECRVEEKEQKIRKLFTVNIQKLVLLLLCIHRARIRKQTWQIKPTVMERERGKRNGKAKQHYCHTAILQTPLQRFSEQKKAREERGVLVAYGGTRNRIEDKNFIFLKRTIFFSIPSSFPLAILGHNPQLLHAKDTCSYSQTGTQIDSRTKRAKKIFFFFFFWLLRQNPSLQ